MPKVPKTTTITIRAIEEDKLRWIDKARRAGMSLTSYISYVMNHTDLKVCLSTGTIDAWRSGQRASPGCPATGERYARRMLDAVKRHELALIALGHKPTIDYVTKHGSGHRLNRRAAISTRLIKPRVSRRLPDLGLG